MRFEPRRLAQPTSHDQRLAALAAPMSEAAESIATRWRQEAERGAAVAVAAEMMRLTLTALEGGG
jgi:cytochrome P450